MAIPVPAPVANLTGSAFGALSALRGKRSFHPFGFGYEGSLRIERRPTHPTGARLLDDVAEHRVIVRASRALGLPENLPDLLGLAIRIPDAHGEGLHQDFLLVTSADGPLLHHLLLFAPGGFFGQSYSSILPYRIGGKVRIVGAMPRKPPTPAVGSDLEVLDEAVADHQAQFDLSLSTLGGRWQRHGTLSLQERMPDAEAEELCFNPWNTGGGIRPTGPFMGLRDPAYRGSQLARGANPGPPVMDPGEDAPSPATTSTASPSS
jgi:hypothetical protein